MGCVNAIWTLGALGASCGPVGRISRLSYLEVVFEDRLERVFAP